jgi:hypothetical protein
MISVHSLLHWKSLPNTAEDCGVGGPRMWKSGETSMAFQSATIHAVVLKSILLAVYHRRLLTQWWTNSSRRKQSSINLAFEQVRSVSVQLLVPSNAPSKPEMTVHRARLEIEKGSSHMRGWASVIQTSQITKVVDARRAKLLSALASWRGWWC